MKKDETVLDLFSGMGGLGTGFSQFFNVTEAVDKWHDACLTYHENHRETTVREKSVSDFLDTCIPKDFDGILFNGIVGGPPCQEFSVLNQSPDMTSARANQLFVFLDAVEAIHPEFALIENVATIPKEKKELAELRLKALGYHTVSRQILAYDFGSVQKRRRWILTASKKRHVFPIPNYPKRTAKEILRGYESYMKMSAEISDQLKTLPTGRWVALPGKHWKEYYIIDPNRPLPAIVNVLKNRIVRPDRMGYVSLKEICLAQGFDENYKMEGGLTSRAQQLANAVPVELAGAFAKAFYQEYHPSASVLTNWIQN